MSAPLLELRDVSKSYGGVRALDRVTFACEGGTIHGILGENGAGKSTLIKIAAGVVQPTGGELLMEGKSVAFQHPLDANAAGVTCVFQELSLLPTLSVADNIGLTMPPGRFGLDDPKARVRRAEELLARVGCEDIDPRAWVGSLPLPRRQMVELAKALGKAPRLLILDEATSALGAADVEKVFRILRALRDGGMGVLYISHRMNEIKELCDVLSVFRNGQHIATFERDRHTDFEIVRLMIGRDLGQIFPTRPAAPLERRPRALTVRHLSWRDQHGDKLDDISFSLGKGEILGLGGLDGQGQKELLLALFGVLRDVRGEVEIDGKPAVVASPRRAKDARHRIALVPEDRKTEGLMLPMGVGANITIASLDKLTKGRGLALDPEKETGAIVDVVRRLQIKMGDAGDPVSTLSGGNQQKVVLGKWLLTDPRILLLNDPTRGIDVGTKQEIYELLRRLADAGTAILFYSTDYDELVGCCDRALILYQGRVVRELAGDELTEHAIVASALDVDAASGASAGRLAPAGRPVAVAPAPARRAARTPGWRLRLGQAQGTLRALALFLFFYGLYSALHPQGFTSPLFVQNANESFVLAAAAMAQTIPVITGGLDLSVGAVVTLVSCLASRVVDGSGGAIAFGVALCLLAGALAGFANGCLIVFGRLQPIIATLASGTILLGVALFVRPTPGGHVDGDLSFALTFDVDEVLNLMHLRPGALGPAGKVPVPLLLLVLLALVWALFRRTRAGLSAYAIGSSAEAAFMSGVRIARAKLAAYTLAGFFAGAGGLYLALQTGAGNADLPQAGAYTLSSIAGVVIGGTSLMGGTGGAIGSILGALVLRALAFDFRVFNEGSALGVFANPLYQPLFEGLILLAAVSAGAVWIGRLKNRLEVFR